MKQNKLTITIPCYNQTALLKRLLASLQKQTRKDFEIIVIDDQSTEDYRETLRNYGDLSIRYVRNERNLGAIKNIFNSILYPVDTPYILSLHEDDVVHPQYIEKALLVLEHDEEVAFVASTAVWFKNDAELQTMQSSLQDITSARFTDDKKHLIKEFVDGTHIAFGSIMYRKAALKTTPDIEAFSVLCDRPFLASLLQEPYKSATIIPKAIFVRDHSAIEDRRGSAVRERHILNLYSFYASALLPMSRGERHDFLKHTTNNLVFSYYQLSARDTSLTSFIRLAKERGLFQIRCLRALGVFGLVSYSIKGEKTS